VFADATEWCRCKIRVPAYVAALGCALAILGVGGGTATADPVRSAVCEHPSSTVPDLAANSESLRTPPPVFKPGVWWAWPGTPGSASVERSELHAIGQAGFGAAQIFDFGVADWGTPAWHEAVRQALLQAQQDKVCVNQRVGPSWPMASPAVSGSSSDLSSQELVYGQADLVGPSTFSGPPPGAGKTLVAVTAARRASATSTTPPLMLDPNSLTDLTSSVDRSGNLTWQVPVGNWILFGFWSKPTGQTAYNGDMPVVDHFNSRATAAALDYFDAHIFSGDVNSLNSTFGGDMFEDSLEDTVSGTDNMLWTGGFLSQFSHRRGYDLRRLLPLIFVPGLQQFSHPTGDEYADFTPAYDLPNGIGERVRHDYFDTLTDLYADEHLAPEQAWAHRHNMPFSAQVGYGQTLDVSRLATKVDVPSTEVWWGGDYGVNTPENTSLDFYRVMSSGAHISGKPRVTAETGDRIGRTYVMQPADYWEQINRLYSGGVTQISLIDVDYPDGPGSVWPGWDPFKFVTEPWTPNWPQWRDWKPLTAYMGRAQYLLEQGKPRVDLLIYRDNFTGTGVDGSQVGKGFVTGTNFAPDIAAPIWKDGAALQKAGYTYDFTDPVTLRTLGDVAGKRLSPNGPAYKALIVDPALNYVSGISGKAAQRILDHARDGLPVVLVGDLPTTGTSNASPASEDVQTASAFHDLLALPDVRHVANQSDVPAALADLQVEPSVAMSSPELVHPVHRVTAHGDYWYLWNESRSPIKLTVTLPSHGAPYRADLWTGELTPLGQYQQTPADTRIPVSLPAQGAIAIMFARGTEPPLHALSSTAADVEALGEGRFEIDSDQAGHFTTTWSNGTRSSVTLPQPAPADQIDAWHLHVDNAGPSGTQPIDVDLSQLADWRDIPALQSASGSASYTAHVSVPATWLDEHHGVKLSLGDVEGAIQVFVNNRLVSPQTLAPTGQEWPIEGLLHPGSNELRIQLDSTLINRIVGLAKSGDPAYAGFIARPTQATGLLGPVKLIPNSRTIITPPRGPAGKS
jgi:alpha-L-rhamnosidase